MIKTLYFHINVIIVTLFCFSNMCSVGGLMIVIFRCKKIKEEFKKYGTNC